MPVMVVYQHFWSLPLDWRRLRSGMILGLRLFGGHNICNLSQCRLRLFHSSFSSTSSSPSLWPHTTYLHYYFLSSTIMSVPKPALPRGPQFCDLHSSCLVILREYVYYLDASRFTDRHASDRLWSSQCAAQYWCWAWVNAGYTAVVVTCLCCVPSAPRLIAVLFDFKKSPKYEKVFEAVDPYAASCWAVIVLAW